MSMASESPTHDCQTEPSSAKNHEDQMGAAKKKLTGKAISFSGNSSSATTTPTKAVGGGKIPAPAVTRKRKPRRK
jgi:hypothetical protein